MLNDMSRFVRLSSLLQLLPIGLLFGLGFGTSRMDGSDSGYAAGLVAVLVLILASVVGWVAFFLVRIKGGDRALRRDVSEGTAELLASGGGGATTVPGRVQLIRSGGRNDAAVLGVSQQAEVGQAVVFAVIAPDGSARRVLASVPVRLPMPTGGVHPVALHPTRSDVGVLDGRVPPAERESFAQDPRWQTTKLPSNNSVAGGYIWLLPCALAGVAIGMGIGAGVMTLFVALS